jgi:uncharacterized protein
MSTLTQVAPTTTYLEQPEPTYYERRPPSSPTSQAVLGAQQQRNPLDPGKLTYTASWFGLAAGAAALSLLGMRRYGWPAAAGASALGAASIAYMARFEAASPTLERVTLRLPSLPAALDGLRIGQITDTHLGKPYAAQNLAWAIEQMQHEQPDLLALTGDLVGLRKGITELPALMSRLRPPLGVYAVPGNHDYTEGLADMHAALEISDIPLLMNEHRRLRWNGADFWLVGIDDIWDGRVDFAVALDGVPADAFKLLIVHEPDIADEAARYGFAAQLSGHTHGGHLRLPLIGPLARPRFGVRYVMGHYQVADMALYVSRGMSGLPLRLLCRPEATIFTLRRSA